MAPDALVPAPVGSHLTATGLFLSGDGSSTNCN